MQKGEIGGAHRHGAPRRRRGLQLGDGDDVAQIVDLGLEQPRHQCRLGHGDQDHGLGVVQQPDVAEQMLLKLRGPDRWIDRHRHATGQQDAEKAEEVVGAGGQHQGHGLARLQPARLESSGDGARALNQIGVGEGGDDPLVVAVDLDRHPVRIAALMPVQHLQQGRGALRGFSYRGFPRRRWPDGHRRLGRFSATPQDQRQQIARGFGQQHPLVQARVKGPLDPLQQFGARQAVQSQFPFQMAVQGEGRRQLF